MGILSGTKKAVKSGVVAVLNALVERKAKQAAITEQEPLLAELQPGKPAVIYFTAAWCGPCKLVQSPVIKQLADACGDTVQIIEIDIDEKRDVAQRWGVMSVPRTFILDQNLHVYASNMDVARLHLLRQQIAEAQQHRDHPQPMILVRK